MIVSTVALIVMISELPNTVQKFIASMAPVKFSSVNPCSPVSDSGSDVMSDMFLNELMMTMRNGEMNASSSTISTTYSTTWPTFVLIGTLAWGMPAETVAELIRLPPHPSYRRTPAAGR